MRGGENMEDKTNTKLDPQAALHEERKNIDARIQAVNALKTQDQFKTAGREIALAYTHLQEAKMWLGQALGMIGSELPAQFADKAE